MSLVRKIEAEVDAVEVHSETVCSIFLRTTYRIPDFKPGQFLHLALDPYDPSRHWPESRVFSIANSPTRTAQLRITFAVKGPFTRRMIEEATAGRKVWLKLPYGGFTLEKNGAPKILIAGGTGITPFLSFLEYSIDTGTTAPLFLFYGVRSPKLVIFQRLLQECEEKIRSFQLQLFLECDSVAYRAYQPGRLDIAKIMTYVPDSLANEFYLSGPLDMVKRFKTELMERRVSEKKIMIDDWG